MMKSHRIMSDKDFLNSEISLEELQNKLKLSMAQVDLTDNKQRRAQLSVQLIALMKRFRNERLRVEDILSSAGLIEASAGLFCVDWMELYYNLEKISQPKSYWKHLWAALRNK